MSDIKEVKETEIKDRNIITSISGSGGGAGATAFKSNWVTGTRYSKNQQVINNNDLFICLVGHTASSTNEPGVGVDTATMWSKQADSLSAGQAGAATGTGTPSAENPFVTEDTLDAKFSITTGHDHDGTDSLKVTWNNINKTTSSIADIATRSHTALSSIGTNTHTQIDSHVADATKHRQINDSGTSATELWSANKTNTSIAAAMFGVLDYQEEPVIDKDLSTPPSPVEGARYIVKATGADAWVGLSNNIVQYITDAWVSTPAVAGMVVWVTDEALLYLFTGNTWLPVNDFVLSQTNPAEIDYDSVTAGVGTTVSKGDHSHNLAAHAHAHDEINLDTINGYTLEDLFKLESAGRISGGIITEGTDGVDVSELQCLLKSTEADVAEVKYIVIPAGNIPSTDLTANALNYICASYNDGTPKFYATTSRASILVNTQIILGRCYIEGDDYDIFNGGINLANSARVHHDRLVMRGFERMSGAVLSEVGTRYLSLTSGIFYFGSNRINISAVNTSTTGTYIRYLRDGNGGWTRVEGLTQVSNNVYDDNSGTPAAIPAGYYAARWVYVCLDGDIYICDGQNYFTLAEAKAVQQPASLPDYIVKNTKLVAKYIISPDEDHFVLIISGYESALFGTTAPTSHQGMAGLQGGATNDYYHLTNTQHTALTTDLTETVQDIAGGMFDGTDTGMTLTYTDSTGKIAGSVTYGTTSDTACEGDDSRLSDARIPTSHTIASHTTSGATDGKVLTASSATEFGWEDPAPTWSQVSGKPTTFAPIIGSGATDAVAGNDARLTNARTPTSHTLASHTTSGAGDGKVLTATSATEFGWEDPAPAWSQVTGKPTTFAPIIGSGATDAVAGNDARLTNTRDPNAHTQTASTITDLTETVQDIAGGLVDGGTETGLSLSYNTTSKKISASVTYGTSSNTACQGNDARLTNTRDPNAHTQAASTITDFTEAAQLVSGNMWSDNTETGLTVSYDSNAKKLNASVTYGTTSDTACEGDDARLSDNRAPTSHALTAHTIGGASDGKVLTATSTSEFGWEDPAPTWGQVTGKPTTFAPIIGSGATDAVAGDDIRLTNARTPTSHTHPSTELSDYVAPVAWVPTIVWSGTAPTDTVTVARYMKIGTVVRFWLSITGADGDGRKITSVTLPVTPANVGMKIACAAQTAAPTTRTDPYAYIVADTATVANRLLQFYVAVTFGNNLAYSLIVSGSYEVA